MSEQFTEYDNQVVTRADMRRLMGLEWLNDEVWSRIYENKGKWMKDSRY